MADVIEHTRPGNQATNSEQSFRAARVELAEWPRLPSCTLKCGPPTLAVDKIENGWPAVVIRVAEQIAKPDGSRKSRLYSSSVTDALVGVWIMDGLAAVHGAQLSSVRLRFFLRESSARRRGCFRGGGPTRWRIGPVKKNGR